MRAGGDDPIRATTVKSKLPASPAAKKVEEALEIPNTFRRTSNLYEVGFFSAHQQLSEALASIHGLENQAERDAVTKGVFAYLASHEPLHETLNAVRLLQSRDRSAALFSTLETITSGNEETMQRAKNYTQRFGLEAGVAMALAYDPAFQPEHADVWIAAFEEDKGIGAMKGTFAAVMVDSDPARALALGNDLKGWDREVFVRTVSGQWAQKNPGDAWDWIQKSVGKFEAGRAESIRNVLKNWAQWDIEGAGRALDQLTDPAERLAAVRALAEQKSFQRGTVEAVQWADSLPTVAEQDAAHAVIGRHSPQGIGAAITISEGYPRIGSLLPNGAAMRSGQLQEGDRIVEVDSGTGEFQNVYGERLEQTLNLIRGESGSTVRLRVVRDDGSGTFIPRIVEITREQIVLEGQTEPVP